MADVEVQLKQENEENAPKTDAKEDENKDKNSLESKFKPGDPQWSNDINNEFSQVNHQFERVLDELKDNGVLDDYRHEYEKLHHALVVSHQNENRLINKTKIFLSELSSNAENIRRTKNEEMSMQSRKKDLEEEISEIYGNVKKFKEAEAKKKADIATIEASVEELRFQISAGSGWTPEQEHEMNQLKDEKDTVSQRVENTESVYKNLTLTCSDMMNQITLMVKENNDLENLIDLTRMEIDKYQKDCNLEVKRRKDYDNELKDMRNKIENQQCVLREKEVAFENGGNEIKELQKMIEDQENETTKLGSRNDSYFMRYKDITKSFDDIVKENEILLSQNKRREQDNSNFELDIKAQRKELRRMKKLKEQTQKRKEQAIDDKNRYQAQWDQMEHERDATLEAADTVKKEYDTVQRKLDDACREREILKKSIGKLTDTSKGTSDLIILLQTTKKNLENEISVYVQMAEKYHERIQQLERERDRYECDCKSANERFYKILEQVKIEDLQIAQLQKKIIEGETKLKQQQNLYETVRADRNLYSKNLLEAHEKIIEMKKKFKLLNQQIEGLKDEITRKDHDLVKEHFDHHKVEKEKDVLSNELTKLKKQIESSDLIINNQSEETNKLQAIIAEAEAEQHRQQKEYTAVVNERDVLGSQLIQRNNELVALYEKIRIQKSSLQKGEHLFTNIMKQIRDLKNTIQEKHRLLLIEKAKIHDIDDLRRTKINLEGSLIEEKRKVSALTIEIERPLNVHRWRHLENSDPEAYKVITKIQRLQKELIEISGQVSQTELMIQQKEKLYVELKNILARQPGPEVLEQIEVYKVNLKEKKHQKKAMEAELQLYQRQVREYKYEIDRIDDRMKELNVEYFENMSKQRNQNQSASMSPNSNYNNNNNNTTTSTMSNMDYEEDGNNNNNNNNTGDEYDDNDNDNEEEDDDDDEYESSKINKTVEKEKDEESYERPETNSPPQQEQQQELSAPLQQPSEEELSHPQEQPPEEEKQQEEKQSESDTTNIEPENPSETQQLEETQAVEVDEEQRPDGTVLMDLPQTDEQQEEKETSQDRELEEEKQ